MTSNSVFQLLDDRYVEELRTRARLYRHRPTGAQVLSLENSDENKCFGITFRTPPTKSTGVAHIMEHSVLCGSEKYPVKDPFIELAKGSLKTFINAFTYPDKTCYPVASTNVQDLYNLIDVYMDAVLHPRIGPQVFQQEAWHYELESAEGPLTRKGVVYNEMRGAYSSPDNVLMRSVQQALFPDTPYGVDSGGDPDIIPTLTYDDFWAFHRTYYHPANARIFFYGDDDPDQRLERIADYLADYQHLDVASQVPSQPRWAQARRVTVPYPVSEDEAGRNKAMLTVSWLYPEMPDPADALSAGALAHILIGTPASPLRKALVDSGLGEDLAGAGYENDLRQTYFSTGLKGIASDSADEVERLIHQTLEDLTRDGIDQDTVEASINTIEFSLRENNTGRFPRGLSLMLRSLRYWLYDRDPIAPIAFEEPLQTVKTRLADNERYFEGLIREWLVENPHRVVLRMEPDPGLGERREAEEKAQLSEVLASWPPPQREETIESTLALREYQSAPDDPQALAKIPSLSLADLKKEAPRIHLTVLEHAGTPILYHDLFTNGLIYMDLTLDLHALPQRLLPYVSLFGDALTGLGTDHEDYVRLSQRIGRNTGGIGCAKLVSSVRGQTKSAAHLVVRGKATVPQTPDLLAILHDILTSTRLDNPARFRQIVLEAKAGSEAALIPAGHLVVNTRLRANFAEADWVNEQVGGLSYVLFLRELADRVSQDWPTVLADLEAVRDTLVNRAHIVANVTLDADNWTVVRPAVEGFLDGLPSAPVTANRWEPTLAPDQEGLTTPAQVNYVGKGANLYDAGYAYHGSVAVISNHLRGTWLWDQIRVQGGAYGAFCLFDFRSGVWTYVSYRDPNVSKSLDAYDRTAGYLRNLDLSQDELTKSIIGTIGSVDAYQLPDAKGYTSMVRYLVGDTDEERQARRDQILSTTKDDFARFADALDVVRKEGRVVVLGSPEKVTQSNNEGGLSLTITPLT